MCGRYSFAPKAGQRKNLEKQVNVPEDLEISFNIAPTHAAYVVANDAPGQLQQMEWGLVPHWSPDGKNTGKMINARSEGIDEKPSFRKAIHSKRCLVPADSFYEWRTISGKKVPYMISLDSGEMIFMAGIWDEWKHGTESKRTFSIITTTPNLEMSALHHRMPVILTDPAIQERWLSDLPFEEVLEMLHPPEDGVFVIKRVSEKLNKPGYNAPDLHDAVPETPTLF